MQETKSTKEEKKDMSYVGVDGGDDACEGKRVFLFFNFIVQRSHRYKPKSAR